MPCGLLQQGRESVPKFSEVKKIIAKMDGVGPEVIEALKAALIRSEHFLVRKFVSFLGKHVTQDFWERPDELFKYQPVLPPITRETFDACLKAIYSSRSLYVHTGHPFPGYVDIGLRAEVPPGLMAELFALKPDKSYLPCLAWFERLCHVVIVEFIRRSVAPELIHAAAERIKEKERVLREIATLPSEAQESLNRLTHWTARFLGAAVMNPYAPNKDWADSSETIRTLEQMGLVGAQGYDLDSGQSWLKDREVGETVGEFVFGVAANPFRDSELLLPRGRISLPNPSQNEPVPEDPNR